ncbi:HAD family hydrolase [Paenibacillus elgii]|nr:HAD hydrolase-like protein [Paenibacillus elgii]
MKIARYKRRIVLFKPLRFSYSPDPAIFIRALSKLGVEATEALFAGDHPENDIRASRAVGMKAAWK